MTQIYSPMSFEFLYRLWAPKTLSVQCSGVPKGSHKIMLSFLCLALSTSCLDHKAETEIGEEERETKWNLLLYLAMMSSMPRLKTKDQLEACVCITFLLTKCVFLPQLWLIGTSKLLKLSEGTTEKASHIFEDAKKGNADVFVVSFLWLA